MSIRIFLIFTLTVFVCNLQAQELVYPKTGMVQSEGEVEFSFNPCQASSQIEFQIATNNSFNLPNIYFIQNTDTLLNFLSGQYFVRARCNPSSAWSSTRSFTIVDLASLGNLVLWLDASDTASLTKDLSDNLSLWENKVNPSVSFAQNSPTKQPQWIPNVSLINNMPAIRFYGDDVLSAGDNFDLNFNSRSIFLISKANSPIANQRYFSKSVATGTPNRFSYGYIGTGELNVLQHGSSPQQIFHPGSSDFSLHTVSFERNTSSGLGKIFSAGVQIGNTISISPNTYNFNSTYRFLIGAYNDATDNGELFYLNGDIPEIIMYDSFLADSARNLVEAYLRFKYAPPVNLGPDVSAYGYCDTTLSAQKDWFKSYLWSTGDTTSSIQVNQPGTYSVTATDFFGYTSTDEVEVLFNTPNTNSSYVSCLEDSFILDIDLNQALTYVWNGTDTSASFTSQSSGNYYYSIFDTLGCSFSDSFSLTIDSLNIQLSLGNDTSICAGNEINIVQNGTTTTNSYLWNTGDTSNFISIDTSGLYYFTSSNANACVASDSINVLIVGQSPITNFSFDTVCAGNSTSFLNLSSAIPPSTITAYNWFIEGDTLSTQNPTYLFDSAGTFLVTLQTETSSGCISDISINVPVKLNPEANFNLPYDACINTPYTLTSLSFASGVDSVINTFWDLGNGTLDTGITIQNQYNINGNYEVSLSVESSNGCTSSFVDSLSVASNALFPQAPFLIEPIAGYTSISPDMQFDWLESSNSISNIFQLALDSTFSNILAEEQDTFTSTSINSLIPQTYFWRVGAINICGDTSYSSINSFTIVDLASLGNLVLWLDASDTASLTKDLSDNLSLWENKVNPSVSFAQNSPTKQPQWIPNVSLINNMPAIRFYGDDVLSAGDNFDLNFNSRSIFLISKANSPIANQRYFSKSVATGTPNRFSYGYIGTGELNVLQHGSSPQQIFHPGSSDFSLHTVSFERNTSSGLGKIFSAGVQIGNTISISPNTYNFNSTYRFLIGAYNDATDNGELFYLNGDIPEIIMYDSFLADSARNLVEAYLRFKYAPPVNLGPDVSAYGYCDTTLSAQKDWFKSYLWSTGDTTSSIQVNQSGTYSVTATDFFGYTSTDEVEVLFNTPNTNSSYVSCLEDSFILDIDLNQALTYVWNGTDTSASFTSQSSGNYYYSIFDTLGCSFSDSFSLTIDSLNIQLSLGNDTSICAGNEINIVQNGTTTTNSYLWNTGDTSNFISIDTSGLYYFTSSNANACVASDSINVLIVGQSPITNFSFDTVCAGNSTSFLNLSSAIPPSTITAYNWFIEGDTLSTQNPTYLFDSAGTFLVTLQTETSSGCISDISINVPVKLNPEANFNLPYDACINTPYTLTSLSFASGVDSVINTFWDLGNGTLDTGITIQNQYNINGNYEVSLSVESSNGCTSSFVDSLSVASNALFPQAPFLIEPIAGYTSISPDMQFDWLESSNSISNIFQLALDSTFSNILAEEQDTFTSTSINSLIPQTYFWRVGAINICGDTSYSSINSFTIVDLASLGNLVLWLDASDTASLTKDLSDNLSLWENKVNPSVSFAQNSPTKQPQWIPNVSLINNMPAIRFYGDDVLSAGDNFDLNFNSRSIFLISKANSPIANQRYFSKSVATGTPNRFSYGYIGTGELNVLQHGSSPQQIFHPGSSDFSLHTVSFERNTSSGLGKIFSAGVQIGNTISISPNTYNFNSTYRFLIGAYNDATDNGELFYLNGDIPEIIMYDSFLADSARNLVEAYLRFKYAPPVNLGPDVSVAYGYCDINLTAQKDWFKSYLWSTGDTSSSIQVNQSGTYSVIVTDFFGYTSTDEVQIDFNAPNLDQDYLVCIENGFSVDINLNQTLDYVWNGTDTTTSFSSLESGEYYYTLYDTLACSFSDTFSLVVDSFNVQMSIGNDTSFCTGNELTLLESGNYSIDSYLWSTGDTLSFTSIGTSSSLFWLESENVNQCYSTDTVFINVLGLAPTAMFSFDTLCATQDVQFTDQSISSGSIFTSWDWSFGNMDSANIPNPTTSFSNASSYSISLEVGTAIGCYDDTTMLINVNQIPSANFGFDIICAQSDAGLTDESISNSPNPINTWFWDFSNGQTSSNQIPVFYSSTEGNYPVSLAVSNEFGCYDTITKLVEVFPALNASFEFSNICIGDTVQFMDNTASFSTIDRLWNFGFFNQNSTDENPKFYYPSTGNYAVNLRLINAIGCVSDTTQIIEIRSLPVANAGVTNNCVENEVLFYDSSFLSNASLNTQIWEIENEIFFGDSIEKLFDSNGNYSASYEIIDNFGCADDTIFTFDINELPLVDFNFTPNYGTAPIDVSFTNLTQGATDFLWNFGELGNLSNDENPTYTYTENGVYNITLIAGNQFGCIDSLSKEIPIIPTDLDIALSNLSIQKTTLPDGSIAYTPSVLVQNVGSRTITNVDLSAAIGSETKVAETWEGTLTIGQAFIYEFNSFFIINNSDLVDYICVAARNVNDNTELNFSNNKACLLQNGLIQSSRLYPNPSQSVSYMDVVTTRGGTIELGIYNVLGQVIILRENIEVVDGYNQIAIDCSSLQSGEYFVRMIFQDEVYSQVLIISNK